VVFDCVGSVRIFDFVNVSLLIDSEGGIGIELLPYLIREMLFEELFFLLLQL
jgi:hypothetical protein